MDTNFLEEIQILIVEDSDIDRKVLVNTIKKYFPRTIEANNGQKAYEIYRKNKNIDIIISDIDMPEMSGIELLKLIRQSDMHIPFIFTTGRIEIEYILDAINLNVSSYITKPINVHEMIQKIDFLCEKKYIETRLLKKQDEIENYIEAVDRVALIYKMTENGNITYMNNSMLDVTGYTNEEIETLNFDQIINPEVYKKDIDKTWEHLKKGKLWKGNTKFITKDKETFYLNCTIFKINNSEEEFITIAFLTTKENLAKRDFYRKVLQNVKETNKKEYKLKKMVKELNIKLDQQDKLLTTSTEMIFSLKEKAKQKERQLRHYELQGENLDKKYEKLLNSKKDEIKSYIENAKTEKKRADTLQKEKDLLEEELKKLREKFMNLEDDIKIKNKRINDLNELVSLSKNKV